MENSEGDIKWLLYAILIKILINSSSPSKLLLGILKLLTFAIKINLLRGCGNIASIYTHQAHSGVVHAGFQAAIVKCIWVVHILHYKHHTIYNKTSKTPNNTTKQIFDNF